MRDRVGRVMHRLVGYARQVEQQQRRDYLRSVCRAHPTANIDAADVGNQLRDPDLIVVGENTAVLGQLLVLPVGGNIRIGERCFVGPGSRVWSACSVSIGNYVLISHNVNIHDNISHSVRQDERRLEIDQVMPSLRMVSHEFDLKRAPLVIEDDVWIGFGASIIGGVRIGRGAIIGAGAMVTRNVAANAIVVGNPMRQVNTVSEISL
jgi:acetyltransferase-like isoleucine patch superfamily enzyme